MEESVEKVDLSGEWSVKLGGYQEISKDPTKYRIHQITLPGSLTENNIGYDVDLETPWMGFTGRGGFTKEEKYAPFRTKDNFKIPFWLQPIKYYQGKAVYSKTIPIHPNWRHQQIFLFLERCHWQSTLWINHHRIDSKDSLATPHQYPLTPILDKLGYPTEILVEIEIDNNYIQGVGIDAHSITDHTQTNWNGIIGKIELHIKHPLFLNKTKIVPNYGESLLQFRLEIENHFPNSTAAQIMVQSQGKLISSHIGAHQECSIKHGKNVVEIIVPYPREIPHWDEFSPQQVDFLIQISSENHTQTYSASIGLRQITHKDHQFELDGRKIFLRGTLDCCTFPLTGYPAMNIEAWQKIFQTCKDHGLNHIRFHSWCPPEAAFAAADEVGMYLQPECGVWRGISKIRKNWGFSKYLLQETRAIIETYAHHPSFLFLCHGNESWSLRRGTIEKWVKFAQKDETRFLISGSAHFKLTKYDDYHQVGPGTGFFMRYHKSFNKSPPATMRNYNKDIERKNVPLIAHEIGQWCVLPNLKEIKKYTGCLKPRNFEIVEKFMQDNQILVQTESLFMASGRFQAMIYKESIEAMLRTQKLGGFQLLDLNDFPGQGTALVGVLDAFWEEKGYISPKQFKQFCGPIVILAEMEKRVWKSSETLFMQLKIAQFSQKFLRNQKLGWKIVTSADYILFEDSIVIPDIPIGLISLPMKIDMKLNTIDKPTKVTVYANLEGTDIANEWDIWVFPELDPSALLNLNTGDVLITESWDEVTSALEKGDKVLYLPNPKKIPHATHGSFEPIFWNTAWFPNQKMHTLGHLIQENHPIFQNFPTDSFSNWHWWDLINRSKPIIISNQHPEIIPIVQPIDDWNTSRKLGLLLELQVGKGKLVVCSIDLCKELDNRIVAAYLKKAILSYMKTNHFNPSLFLTEHDLQSLFTGFP